MVNSMCLWLKRCIWRFIGTDTKNLQSYLNWFVCLFGVRQTEARWLKTESVRHLLMSDAHYRTS